MIFAEQKMTDLIDEILMKELKTYSTCTTTSKTMTSISLGIPEIEKLKETFEKFKPVKPFLTEIRMSSLDYNVFISNKKFVEIINKPLFEVPINIMMDSDMQINEAKFIYSDGKEEKMKLFTFEYNNEYPILRYHE